MKKIFITLFILALFMQYSCITDKDKYKETDIYEEFEAEDGFAIFHLPPVLFRIFLSMTDDTDFNSKELLNKIEVIKLMFFEESENSMKMDDLKTSMSQKLKDYNYNLLTRIAQENNDISIYIIKNEKIIHEVLITIISDSEYISLNLVGELTQDEVMEVYKAVNMDNIRNYNN